MIFLHGTPGSRLGLAWGRFSRKAGQGALIVDCASSCVNPTVLLIPMLLSSPATCRLGSRQYGMFSRG